MTLTRKQTDTLRRKIERVVAAAVEDSHKGSQHPDDVPEIERELRVAQQNLENYLNKLEDK
jgi:predicted extracellular nuclease